MAMKAKLLVVITMLCMLVALVFSTQTQALEKSISGNGASKMGGRQTTGGTYRVVLNGFRVNRETFDTAFEADGKGDEVFIISEAGAINGAGAIVQRFSRESKIYGDVNGFSNRVQAGSRSDLGGLKTGDRFPLRNLSEPRARGLRILDDNIPMLLWQGELFADQNAAVIMPTIWEWDLRSANFPAPGQPIAHEVPPATFIHGRFDEWLRGSFGQFVLRNRRSTFATAFVGTAERTGWIRERSAADIFTMGTNGTRVIGLQQDARVYDTDVFRPQVLILTFAAAERALQSSHGIFEITYEEPRCCGLEGSYTLLVQLERLPQVTVGP